MSFEDKDSNESFDSTLIQLVSFERQRQRRLPEDHEDKIKRMGRGYPIAETITVAQRRITQIRKSISLRDYIPYDEVDFQAAVDVYIAECVFGEDPFIKEDMVFLSEFKGRAVEFEESYVAYRGVMCHVYKFVDTDEEDLAIINVKPDTVTPRQRVLDGERTIEHFVKGIGSFVVEKVNGSVDTYDFDDQDVDSSDGFEVQIGQIMQWNAGPEGLVFAELCRPPYQDGRFENLNEQSDDKNE